jgi:hypothetical protein
LDRQVVLRVRFRLLAEAGKQPHCIVVSGSRKMLCRRENTMSDGIKRQRSIALWEVWSIVIHSSCLKYQTNNLSLIYFHVVCLRKAAIKAKLITCGDYIGKAVWLYPRRTAGADRSYPLSGSLRRTSVEQPLKVDASY